MRLNRTEIRMVVADIWRSAEFYQQTLGFVVSSTWPNESPEFAILECDEVRLQLERRGTSAPATVWIDVDDADALHARIRPLVSIEWGPEVYSYGRKEFAFSDPDHNHIIVSAISDLPPDSQVG